MIPNAPHFIKQLWLLQEPDLFKVIGIVMEMLVVFASSFLFDAKSASLVFSCDKNVRRLFGFKAVYNIMLMGITNSPTLIGKKVKNESFTLHIQLFFLLHAR